MSDSIDMRTPDIAAFSVISIEEPLLKTMLKISEELKITESHVRTVRRMR
jgi:hypothetical protein